VTTYKITEEQRKLLKGSLDLFEQIISAHESCVENILYRLHDIKYDRREIQNCEAALEICRGVLKDLQPFSPLEQLAEVADD